MVNGWKLGLRAGSAALLLISAGFAACSSSSSQVEPGTHAGAAGSDGGSDAGSIGGDNANDPQDENAGSPSGGSGGQTNGGTAGSSGHPNGGSAGSGSSIKLGRACTQAQDCADPRFPELTCITSQDAVLGNGAPPKGLCTMPCTVPAEPSSVDACEKLSPGALCFPFNDSAQGYCVEGCSFGPPSLGEPEKCHNRPEFACNPALLGATNDSCEVSSDCQVGELCSQGVCNVVLPACLPACAGDIDCDPGMYCDQSYLSGVCVTKKQTGKSLGEPCTVPAPNQPDEPDDCLGYCAADTAGSSQGHCASTCTYGAPCAWNTATEKYDGACILANQQLVGSPDVGDFGYCDLTCDCASSCLDPSLGCELIDQALPEQFRGGGFCLEPSAASVPYDQCAAGAAGAAGAGGAGAGGAGAGGAGG